jgi:hypothetical protein
VWCRGAEQSGTVRHGAVPRRWDKNIWVAASLHAGAEKRNLGDLGFAKPDNRIA